MLVISRKPGERVRIGPDVWITVIQFKHGKVRIGIDCDKEKYPIAREELLPEKEQLRSRLEASDDYQI